MEQLEDIVISYRKHITSQLITNAGMDAAYDYAVAQLNAAKNDYRRVYDTFYNSNDNPYTDDKLRGLYAFNRAQNYFLTNNPNAEMK